jgi:co-chaperonin GroES (HSP10)
MMTPANRHLLIRPIDHENESPSGVLLPEDYKSKNEKYTTAEVVLVSEDSKFFNLLGPGDRVCFEKSMLQEVSIPPTKTLSLVLENYVILFEKVEK